MSMKLWVPISDKEQASRIAGCRFDSLGDPEDICSGIVDDPIALLDPKAFDSLPIIKVSIRGSVPANHNSLRGVFQLGAATAEVEIGHLNANSIVQETKIISTNVADAQALYLAIKTCQMEGVTVVHRYQHPTPPAHAEDQRD